jgi:hypothetical protein
MMENLYIFTNLITSLKELKELGVLLEDLINYLKGQESPIKDILEIISGVGIASVGYWVRSRKVSDKEKLLSEKELPSKTQRIESQIDTLSTDNKTELFDKDNNIYKYFFEQLPKAKKSIDIARFNVNKDDVSDDDFRSKYYEILSKIINSGEIEVSRIYRLSNMNDFKEMEKDFYEFANAKKYNTYCFIEKKSVISLPNLMIIDKEKIVFAPPKKRVENSMVTENKKVVAVMENYMTILRETANEVKSRDMNSRFRDIKLEIDRLVPILDWIFECIENNNKNIFSSDELTEICDLSRDVFGFVPADGWGKFNEDKLSQSTHVGKLVDKDSRIYGIAYYSVVSVDSQSADTTKTQCSTILWENSIFMVNSAQGKGLADLAIQKIEDFISKDNREISHIGCITQHPAMFARYLKFANGNENNIFPFNGQFDTSNRNKINGLTVENINQIKGISISKNGIIEGHFKKKIGDYSVVIYASRKTEIQQMFEKQKRFEDKLQRWGFKRKSGDGIILIASKNQHDKSQPAPVTT